LLEKYLKYQFYVKNLHPGGLRLFHFFYRIQLVVIYHINIYTQKSSTATKVLSFHRYMLQVSTVMTILRYFSTRL